MTKSNESGWNFDNSYTKLPEFFYSNTNPTPVRSPEMVKFNEPLAKSIGLHAEDLQTEDATAMFAGNDIPTGASPIAQAYAGHQFGHFTMLGDGRAILLGEHITPTGERYDIQLKGPGRTPYSRGGDGRAALGPMLREYIISEAMYALGIPTTRSLAVVSTGQPVIRETNLPGAILTRVASSHIRVGTFQYAAKWGSVEDTRALADYTIHRHYPEIADHEDKYLSFLKAVINQQAKLISQWQLVGFIHGVMNTDNMTISGETIDYGPCAFMDTYDPETVFSSIDAHGRYAYRNQPGIGGWNLARFAETLLDLLHDNDEEAVKIAQEAISEYPELSRQYWLEGMRAKLGIFDAEEQDETLINDLLNVMKQYKADYTNTFRALTREAHEESVLQGTLEFNDWYKRWLERLSRQVQSKEAALELMRKNNPSIIPRNHRVEEALDAAQQDDYSVMDKLLEALANPYDYTSVQKEYCKLPESTGLPYRTYCGT